MNEHRIPTDRELDELLTEQPRFDLNAVKARTLSRIEGREHTGKKLPLRGLCIAAVVCALSVTALASVTDTPIARIFRKAPAVEEPPAIEVPAVEEPVFLPDPVPEPVPEPEPPRLDAQVAQALELTEQQAETLRPAVQEVQTSVQDQEVTMTVLQTVGDSSALYIKLRFDFPAAVPPEEDLTFRRLDAALSGSSSYSHSFEVLERTETSVTYLLCLRSESGGLQGQTLTLTFSDYGRCVDLPKHLQLGMDRAKTLLVSPDGDIREAEAADLDVVSTEERPHGFTLSRCADGSTAVTYDGLHGQKYLTILDDGTLLTGEDPTFKTLLRGSWEQSWVLEYEELSRSWTGEERSFCAAAALTELRLTPFTLTASFRGEDVYALMLLERDFWTFQLRTGEGELLPLTSTGTSYAASGDGTALTMQVSFSAAADLARAEALVVSGVEFPLS
ncbi:MAG: hypothetical protein IJZ66_00335 [Oscillibacter sp.]|nr:hypothetical protein [Oscillibacter sp.]